MIVCIPDFLQFFGDCFLLSSLVKNAPPFGRFICIYYSTLFGGVNKTLFAAASFFTYFCVELRRFLNRVISWQTMVTIRKAA
jgi:hypothetical protein